MSKHTAENWKIKTLPTEEHNTIRDKYNVPVCYGALKANARLLARVLPGVSLPSNP